MSRDATVDMRLLWSVQAGSQLKTSTVTGRNGNAARQPPSLIRHYDCSLSL